MDYVALDLSEAANAGLEAFGDNPAPACGGAIWHGLPFRLGSGDPSSPWLIALGPGGAESRSLTLQRRAEWMIFAHVLVDAPREAPATLGRTVAEYEFAYADGGAPLIVPVRDRFEVAGSSLAGRRSGAHLVGSSAVRGRDERARRHAPSLLRAVGRCGRPAHRSGAHVAGAALPVAVAQSGAGAPARARRAARARAAAARLRHHGERAGRGTVPARRGARGDRDAARRGRGGPSVRAGGRRRPRLLRLCLPPQRDLAGCLRGRRAGRLRRRPEPGWQPRLRAHLRHAVGDGQRAPGRRRRRLRQLGRARGERHARSDARVCASRSSTAGAPGCARGSSTTRRAS